MNRWARPPVTRNFVVTVRQPLLDDLFSHFDVNELLPPSLQTDIDTLSASTDRLVLSLRPGDRGATLALVPAGRYPAQLMGWQLHLSDLAFRTVDDSGVPPLLEATRLPGSASWCFRT